LPREEALLVVVPGLREDAVAAPFPAGAAFLFAAFFLAGVVLTGTFGGGPSAPSALQASAIIAAMAA
jgi:hypothetical protein